MANTVGYWFSAYGWSSIASTLRQIEDSASQGAVRLELAPASPFAGDPEFDSSSLSAWTLTNSGNVASIDANTTLKSALFIIGSATSCDWYNSTRNGAFVNQVLSGNFNWATGGA